MHEFICPKLTISSMVFFLPQHNLKHVSGHLINVTAFFKKVLPVFMMEMLAFSQLGSVCPMEIEVPTTKMFLGDDMSTNWRLERPTDSTIPV